MKKPKVKKVKLPKTLDQERKAFCISAMRRMSKRWPARNEALGKARISRGVYRCAHCQGSFKKKDTELDHREPVVDIITGYIDLEIYAQRLFCSADNYQVLCIACHSAKTSTEAYLRSIQRDKKKKLDNPV